MFDIGHELIEVALLDLLKAIRNLMQRFIDWGMGPDSEATAACVAPTGLKTRAVALVPKA